MPRARAARFPQLDGLRAIAALSVFATHVTFLTGWTDRHWLGHITARLNLGVALFFVLSGFLLYRPWAVARQAGTPGPDLRRYAARRVARILPAYWVALGLLAIVIPHYVPQATGHRWWAYFGLLQVYGQHTILGGIGPAWSLCTELAFYVALPLYALGAIRLTPRQELGFLAVSTVLAFVAREVADRHGWLGTYDNTLPGKWPWFAIGLAFATLSADDGRARRGAGWPWWIAAAALLALSAAVLPQRVFTMTHDDLQLETLLFGAIAICLLAPLLFGPPGTGPARLLSAPWIVWVGTISYGIFLWHYPLIGYIAAHVHGELAVAVLSLAAATALASASWYLLESPVIRRAHRRRLSAGG